MRKRSACGVFDALRPDSVDGLEVIPLVERSQMAPKRTTYLGKEVLRHSDQDLFWFPVGRALATADKILESQSMIRPISSRSCCMT